MEWKDESMTQSAEAKSWLQEVSVAFPGSNRRGQRRRLRRYVCSLSNTQDTSTEPRGLSLESAVSLWIPLHLFSHFCACGRCFWTGKARNSSLPPVTTAVAATSIIFCLGDILFACWNHVLFPITDVKDGLFLIILQALREFKEQKICQEQFTNWGYLYARLPGLRQIQKRWGECSLKMPALLSRSRLIFVFPELNKCKLIHWIWVCFWENLFFPSSIAPVWP